MSLSSLELVKISKQISDISELGLYLKFSQTEVDAFEKENDKDLTRKKGTRDMLKLWYQKDGSTKDMLVKALRLSDMGKFADMVEQGILPDEHKRFLELDVKPSNTVSTIPQASRESGSFDDILKTVARKVVKNDDIDYLGSALGLEVADRERYIATNSRYHNISYSGTLDMLRDWQERQTRSTKRVALKTALEESGNIRLADEIFGEGTMQTTSEETVSATPRPSASSGGIPQGASAATPEVSTSQASVKVSDGKLDILARRVPNWKYIHLSFELGIEYNEATNIFHKHGNDVNKAIRECLGVWKDKTGGSLTNLKEILRKAELGGLIRYVE